MKFLKTFPICRILQVSPISRALLICALTLPLALTLISAEAGAVARKSKRQKSVAEHLPEIKMSGGPNKIYFLRQSDSAMVQFDVNQMKETARVPVPLETFTGVNPPKVQINAAGQFLILIYGAENELFYWDGEKGRIVDHHYILSKTRPWGDAGPYLSADGQSFYYGDNTEEIQSSVKDPATHDTKGGLRLEDQESNTFRFFRKALTVAAKGKYGSRGSGRAKSAAKGELLAEHVYEPCACPTGLCKETCPIGSIEFPESIIDGSFILFGLVEGPDQIRSSGFIRFDEATPKWTATPLEPGFDAVLDARGARDLIVRLGGTARAGWENLSNQRTLLIHDGTKIDLYDQYKEHHNEDYDVSFFNSTASFSPSGHQIAMKFRVTHNECQSIEDCGDSRKLSTVSLRRKTKRDVKELEAILKEMPRYPVTRIVDVGPPLKKGIEIDNSSPVAWLSDDRLLLLSGLKWFIFDVSTQKKTELPFTVLEKDLFVPPLKP